MLLVFREKGKAKLAGTVFCSIHIQLIMKSRYTKVALAIHRTIATSAGNSRE